MSQVTAQQQAEDTLSFYRRFQKEIKDPAERVAAAKRYLGENRDNPRLNKAIAGNIFIEAARIQWVTLQDNESALATINEALGFFDDEPGRYRFYGTKSDILLRAGRAEEAEATLAAPWPGMVQADPGAALGALPVYVAVLNKQDKGAAALDVARNLVQQQVLLAGDNRFIKVMTDQLLAQSQTDKTLLEEALGWAKLQYVLAPYDEKALQEATQTLVRVWSAKHNAPAKTQELLAAMQNPQQANPLREIKLPSFDPQLVQAQAKAAAKPQEKITLLLTGNDTKSAMIEAQRMVLSAPASPEGVLEVCRVFKAHDLDIQRANAFLDYYIEGGAANPVVAFLQA